MPTPRVAPGGVAREPTWRMVDGTSTESLALEVARNFALPPAILRRATSLYQVASPPSGPFPSAPRPTPQARSPCPTKTVLSCTVPPPQARSPFPTKPLAPHRAISLYQVVLAFCPVCLLRWARPPCALHLHRIRIEPHALSMNNVSRDCIFKHTSLTVCQGITRGAPLRAGPHAGACRRAAARSGQHFVVSFLFCRTGSRPGRQRGRCICCRRARAARQRRGRGHAPARGQVRRG